MNNTSEIENIASEIEYIASVLRINAKSIAALPVERMRKTHNTIAIDDNFIDICIDLTQMIAQQLNKLQ